MKKRAPVLCFHLVLLAVFLTIPAAFAHPNQPLIIDFRPVAPVEKMSLSLPFTLPVATAEVVRFEGTGLCAVKPATDCQWIVLLLPLTKQQSPVGN